MANKTEKDLPDASSWRGCALKTQQPEAGESEAAIAEAREVMSLDQFHQWMQQQWELRERAGPRQSGIRAAYEAAEDVGSVRLLRLQAALKARRASESER
jgi:hypothetical protein